MSDFDPYAAPETNSDGAGLGEELAVRELVVEWEKLRVRYHLILLPFGLAAAGVWVWRGFDVWGVVFGSLFFGAGANVAFLLGPLAELYFRGVFAGGRARPGVRRGLFWVGLLFSGVVILFYGFAGFFVFAGW